MQNISMILAQQAGGSSISSIIMIVAMIVIFYFFMIRPQQKKQKTIQKQRDAMTKGDKVVTAGGIHGRITSDKGTYMLVEIANGVNIRVDKGSLYPEADNTEASKNSDTKKEEKVKTEESPND